MTNIKKVLIANRGEIACRILKTLNKMGISGVVVYHRIDSDSPALKMAEEAVEIQGQTPVGAYLDMEQIISVCKKTNAFAVHPGFGFLAENPEFAGRLEARGITFIGPSPQTMTLMGNKIAARAFCMENNFPLAPSITESDAKNDFLREAQKIGPPLLIKAAAGGGGKGMHIVKEIKNLETAVKLAKGEALRSFGDDTVYAERYVERPRHIEVQVLADHLGNVIHLGERECSIQRRFQKIIEESPAPGLLPDLRNRICETAVSIAQKAGYRNAGTVEFILAPDNKFYFLEMNTRIQVEHPVTEMVTGLDLVEMQIRIAAGETLPLRQEDIISKGHAIEMRIYAENPENDFLPSTGKLLAYQLKKGAGVRVDDGFRQGMTVTSAFDPMLAKTIVHGEDRHRAIDRAIRALEASRVLGVTTNIDFLKQVLSHAEFKSGNIDTGFIPRHSEALLPPPLTDEQLHLLLAAAALSHRDFVDPQFHAPEPYATIGNWRN